MNGVGNQIENPGRRPLLSDAISKIVGACIRALPPRLQRRAAKRYFFRQIENRRFDSSEVEWQRLAEWLSPGDWCIDVGANVGRYTLRMSDLVGSTGHVIAFEPLTSSFDLLTHFVTTGGYQNVTLLNAAATNLPSLIGITADFSATPEPCLFHTNTGTRITAATAETGERKLGLTIDSLMLPSRIHLIKIDVEGHELQVCRGMAGIIERDHPTLIVEDHKTDTGVPEFLRSYGYDCRRLTPISRNLVFLWP